MNEQQSQEQIKQEGGLAIENIPSILWWQKKTTKIMAIILLVVIFVGAVFYKVYASPEKVWHRFSEQYFSSVKSYIHEDFEISYQDNGQLEQGLVRDGGYGSLLNKIKLSLSGSAYINNQDFKNPEISGDVTYSLASGGTFLGSKFSIIFKDQSFYLKVADLPFLAEGLKGMTNGKQVDWVKINFKELQEYINNAIQSSSTPYSLTEQVNKYQEIVNKHWAKLVAVNSVLGKEKIKNINTIHFSNKVDKVELTLLFKEIFESAIEESLKPYSSVTEKDKNEIKTQVTAAVNSILEKMEVKKFETWIGVSDARIYRLNLVASAPSLASLINVGSKLEQDLTPEQTTQQKIDYLLSAVKYDAEIIIDEKFYDYGKIQEVKEPDNALDLVEKAKEQDRKRNEMLESYKADANF